jgi:hypothetical protein
MLQLHNLQEIANREGDSYRLVFKLNQRVKGIEKYDARRWGFWGRKKT